MKGGKERKKRRRNGRRREPMGWCSYPETVVCAQGTAGAVGPAVADQANRRKHMVMSPPSGRQQNSWSWDKLRQSIRQNNRMC